MASLLASLARSSFAVLPGDWIFAGMFTGHHGFFPRHEKTTNPNLQLFLKRQWAGLAARPILPEIC